MKANLGKSAAVLTASQLMTTLISLVSSMLLSRFRTLGEYGTYSQILLVINLATALFMLGLPNSTNFFLARADTPEERRHFLGVYYSLSTILCAVIGLCMSVSVPLIVAYFENELIRDFVYILVLLPWTKVIIGSLSNVMVVYGKTVKLTVFNLANAAIALVTILIVKLFGWSFREYMLLYLLGEMGMMVWVYGIVWGLEGALRLRLDGCLIKQIFKYSIPIGLASLVGTLSLEIDKLMIGKLLDTEALAIYANAGKELPVTVIATSLTAVLLPQMAKKMKVNDADGAVSLWGDAVELSYIFMAFIVTTMVVFAPQIMTILYSEKYLPGVAVFRVYSAVMLLRITYFGIMLNSLGRTKIVFYCSIVVLAINVILNYVLYLVIGFIGPAVATFFAVLITQATQLIASSKLLHIPFRRIFPWKRLALHSVINLVWGSIAYAVLSFLGTGVTTKEILCCVLSGIPICLLYLVIEKNCLKKLWNNLNEST